MLSCHVPSSFALAFRFFFPETEQMEAILSQICHQGSIFANIHALFCIFWANFLTILKIIMVNFGYFTKLFCLP